MKHKGVLVVVSGPSGVGKGTVLKRLIKKNDNIKFAISATTRNPRVGEVDKENYFFKTIDEFKKMIDHEELLEWVNYCGNYYGKPREYVEESLKAGYDVIVEVEVEGAQNIKRLYPECILIFIMPPSFEELERRIECRGTESKEVIHNRLERARDEILQLDKYDYCIINDRVDEAVNSLAAVIRSAKHRINNNNNFMEHIKKKYQE